MSAKNKINIDLYEVYLRFIYLNQAIKLPRTEFEQFKKEFVRKVRYFYKNVTRAPLIWNNSHYLVQLYRVMVEEDKEAIQKEIQTELDWLFDICRIWIDSPNWNGVGVDEYVYRTDLFHIESYYRWVWNRRAEIVYPPFSEIKEIYIAIEKELEGK